MTKTILNYLLILIAFVSCSNPTSNYRTDFKINESELKYKKGDYLSFRVDTNLYGTAVVIDYSKDEGGLWYGLCFTNYLDINHPDTANIDTLSFYGRKIESKFEDKGYFIGLDIEFVNDSCFMLNDKKFQLIGNVKLALNKIKFGAQGATSEYNSMISSFKFGREKRKTPPDHYTEHRTKLNGFRPDEYFKVTDFINN